MIKKTTIKRTKYTTDITILMAKADRGIYAGEFVSIIQDEIKTMKVKGLSHIKIKNIDGGMFGKKFILEGKLK